MFDTADINQGETVTALGVLRVVTTPNAWNGVAEARTGFAKRLRARGKNVGVVAEEDDGGRQLDPLQIPS